MVGSGLHFYDNTVYMITLQESIYDDNLTTLGAKQQAPNALHPYSVIEVIKNLPNLPRERIG